MTIQEFVDELVKRDLAKEPDIITGIIPTTRNCRRIYQDHGLPRWENFGKLNRDRFRLWLPPKNKEKIGNPSEWYYVDFNITNPDMELSKLFDNPEWRGVCDLMAFLGAEDIFAGSDEYVDLDNIVF